MGASISTTGEVTHVNAGIGREEDGERRIRVTIEIDGARTMVFLQMRPYQALELYGLLYKAFERMGLPTDAEEPPPESLGRAIE